MTLLHPAAWMECRDYPMKLGPLVTSRELTDHSRQSMIEDACFKDVTFREGAKVTRD